MTEHFSAATAAHEVDDFQVVSIFQRRFRPAVAGDDVAVEFYSYAVGLHGEGLDQRREREGGCGIGKGARFTVDVQGHSE